MKKYILIIFFFPVFSFCQSWFDNYEGLNVESLGRADTGIAMPLDSTGIWKNPSSTAQNNKFSFSFVFEKYEGRWKSNTLKKGDFAEYDILLNYTEIENKYSGLDGISLNFPVKIFNKDFSFSLGFRNNLIFADYRMQNILLDYYFMYYKENTEYYGNIKDFTINLSKKILKEFSFGINLHYYSCNMKNYWQTSSLLIGGSPFSIFEQKFDGFSYDIGFMGKITKGLNFGIVYKEGLKENLDYRYYTVIPYPDWEIDISGKGKIVLPKSYGAGILYSPLNKIAILIDYNKTRWSDSKLENVNFGNSINEDVTFPVLVQRNLKQNDKETISLGIEYIYTNQLKFRIGYGKSKYPINFLDNYSDLPWIIQINYGRPAYDFISFGLTKIIKNLKFDFAYVYSFWDKEEVFEKIAYYGNSHLNRISLGISYFIK